MTEVAYDGTPLQAGLNKKQTNLTGEHAQFSVTSLREAVVVDRKFSDEKGNRSRAYVEYTCRDLYSGEMFYRCRRLTIVGGAEDGQEDVLHPQTKLLPGAKSQKLKRSTAAVSTDGDRVLLGFVEGSQSRPIILGVIIHTSATYGATADDGERRYSIHKGTSIEIKSDGAYLVTGSAEIKLLAKATAVVDGSSVLLGQNAIQPVIRGTDMQIDVMTPTAAALTTAITALAQIISDFTLPGVPVTPVLHAEISVLLGLLNTLFQAMLSAFNAFNATLSTKVYSE